jgi:hypothetical protein
MKKIVINGLFLTQQLSGLQRNAIELVKELDKIIEKDSIELAVPSGTEVSLQLRNIKIIHFGRFKGRLWEQVSFLLYIIRNHRIALNFCNTAPLFKPGIVLIADVIFKHKRNIIQDKTKLVNYLSREFQNRMYINKAVKVLTISEFSKQEISRFYKKSVSKLKLVPCAWQHYQSIEPDDSIFNKLESLRDNIYCFAISNVAKHKNFKWVMETAKLNPSLTFVIAGAINSRYFSETIDVKSLKNVIYTGYLSDGWAKSLMMNCEALLYPSFYEGFGIPPMEALSQNRKIVISDIPVHKEIYEDAAYYIDPNKPQKDILELLGEDKTTAGKKVLDKYSWAKSAKILHDLIKE